MAETSALCFSHFSSIPSICRSKESNSFLSTTSSKFSNSNPRSSRSLRLTCKASDSSNFLGDDSFDFFPWSDGDSVIEWIQEEKVTLFTADGLIQIGGSVVPRLVSSSDKKQEKSKTSQRFQRFQESDYMDPKQGLCLGALFNIAATNVVAAEKAIKGGLHEKLTMTVAVPYLWGVPPASETLRLAVRSGGGIVEKVYWQWDFL
ncbi:uncharacterized protein LOC8284002 isoform X2 [Ricinus communis]|uniref:uncharacterized protein LOC8284002 isoform X2 n=1 Tax=Ricinus communis TaxID=3988 RepID=UPI0007723FB3|nr:uncharacterized protein LOC8284002 isoform X2 [Ricinus communis]|eukprot:XP_015574833.1 uncharacterized protein LOC8284002 isoform X2 [Ricinus communis]